MNSKYIEAIYEKIIEQDIFIFHILLDIFYHRKTETNYIFPIVDNIAISSTEWKNIKILFKDVVNIEEKKTGDYNLCLLWGLSANTNQQKTLKNAYLNNKNILIIEDGFLRSIHSFSKTNCIPKYREGISFAIDKKTAYYDSTKVSDLESMLNNSYLNLKKNEIARAKKCIKLITINQLSKYNDSTITRNKYEAKENILVVDQSKGDLSVKMGGCNELTFLKMLRHAIDDNPLANILIKIHPDSINGSGKGYFSEVKETKKIKKISDNINPISLINECSKVYVCTSQIGFEALMCRKEVHVFGIPFYSGWGITIDYQKCDRRSNVRSLEEIFFITYILYSHYVDPYKNEKCEIERAIEILIQQRKEYRLIKNNRITS